MLQLPVHPLKAKDDADEDDGVGENEQHANMHVDVANDGDNERSAEQMVMEPVAKMMYDDDVAVAIDRDDGDDAVALLKMQVVAEALDEDDSGDDVAEQDVLR